MKKIFTISILTFALLGCKGKIEEPIPTPTPTPEPTPEPKDYMTLVAVNDAFKTHLDGLSVLWDEDDAVVVNGVESTRTVVLDDGRKAEFTLPYFEGPYTCIYPGQSYVQDSYNPDLDQYGHFVLPKVQNWVEGSFDKASAIMLAKVEDLDNVVFTHAMAYIKLAITSSHSHPIKKIEISSLGGEDLCGEFRFNTEAMAIEPLAAPSGKALTVMAPASGLEAGSSIYLAIPAADYSSGIRMRIIDVNGHYQDVKSAQPFAAGQGKVYPITVEFVPTGTLINVDVEEGNSPANKPKRILFIGNSHTLDATEFLPQMLNCEGVRDIELVRVYHGGYYLVGYNANYANPTICSITTWSSGQNYWRGSLDLKKSLQEAVEYGDYDLVVMQEYTGNSHCWTWDDAEKNAIKGLVEKIQAANPKAEIIYFLSHIWSSKYSGTITYYGGDTDRMFRDCVNNNLRHAMDPAEGFPFKRCISTAALLQSLRTSGLNLPDGDDLCRGDGVHLDYGMVRQVASLLFWKTIFTPITGIKAEDVKFRYTGYFPGEAKVNTPWKDSNKELVMAAVNAAYENPYEAADLSAYPADTDYADNPGVDVLQDSGVDVYPVTFPVNFPVAYGYNHVNAQPRWNAYAVWESYTQPQAFGKWVNVSRQQTGFCEGHLWNLNAGGGWSTVGTDVVWTGDYMEFVIPVSKLAAGTKLKLDLPLYSTHNPAFWCLDWYDGGQWKSNLQAVSTSDGSFTLQASFVLNYGRNDITQEITLENAISSGFVRVRIRCADGTVITGNTGYQQVSEPYAKTNPGASDALFLFLGTTFKNMSFDIVK